MAARLQFALDRLSAFDLGACRLLQARSHARVLGTFSLVSRLGDGWVWLAMATLLPLLDLDRGLQTIAAMALAAALGLPLYRLLKRGTHRPRPCHALGSGLRAVVPALDQHSFPSGHTLHAVAFTIIIGGAFPALLWALLPFAVLVAVSRVVLGLHYPSDVLAGVVLGTLLGELPRALGIAL